MSEEQIKYIKEVILLNLEQEQKKIKPSEREIVFTTFEGSLAHKNLLKLFQEEIARQTQDLGEGIYEKYRKMPPLNKEEIDRWNKKQMRK